MKLSLLSEMIDRDGRDEVLGDEITKSIIVIRSAALANKPINSDNLTHLRELVQQITIDIKPKPKDTHWQEAQKQALLDDLDDLVNTDDFNTILFLCDSIHGRYVALLS